MNLKEAFHYQNYLGELLTEAVLYLGRDANVTSIKETHHRQVVNPDAIDEVKEVVASTKLSGVNVSDVVDFVTAVINEREAFYKHIAEAKVASLNVIDTMTSINANRRSFISVLKNMSRIKSTETKTRGQDYKFNAEGNQVPYSYEVDTVKTIDFDRNKIRDLMKSMSKSADEASENIDRLMLNTTIYAEPLFDINDSFADAVESYFEYRKADRHAV